MALFKKVDSIKDQKELEYLRAKVEKQNGMIEYLAIMADVDMPEEEGGADEQNSYED